MYFSAILLHLPHNTALSTRIKEVRGSPAVLTFMHHRYILIPHSQHSFAPLESSTEESEARASGKGPPGAVTHRKDCPEAKTRSRRSSERGHRMEAKRAGQEARVRSLMLPGRKQRANICTAVSAPPWSRPLRTCVLGAQSPRLHNEHAPAAPPVGLGLLAC